MTGICRDAEMASQHNTPDSPVVRDSHLHAAPPCLTHEQGTLVKNRQTRSRQQSRPRAYLPVLWFQYRKPPNFVKKNYFFSQAPPLVSDFRRKKPKNL